MNLIVNETKNAFSCVIICLAGLLLAWPFANLPFSDDWSWSLTVHQLNQTGHLVYNGWSSPSVIAQAYWGLLWVKTFGFSFNVLRVSTILISCGVVALTYLLGRKAGLVAELSIFVALMLGLSPLFLPLASSFMTDVPGLFFLLLSALALVCGFEKKSTSWMITGAIAALVGGSSRQVVWIVPLLLLPYFACLRRADRRFVLIAIGAWLVVLVGAASIQRWYSQQPYSLPDPPMGSYLRGMIHYRKIFTTCVFSTVLTTVSVILPAGIAIFDSRLRPRAVVALPIFFAITGLGLLLHHVLFPWLGNMICPTGILGDVELYGDRDTVLSPWMLMVISVLVAEVLAFLLAWLAVDLCWPGNRTPSPSPGSPGEGRGEGDLEYPKSFDIQNHPHPSPLPAYQEREPEQRAGVHLGYRANKVSTGEITVKAMSLILLGLFALELTRCVFDVAYDRHTLAFIPFAAIPLLKRFQMRGLKRMPRLAWITLVIFAIYAIASTQELDSLARARVVAIAKLEAAGVQPNQIEGGFEHDYWTEALTAGYVNDARVNHPSGAYHREKGPLPHSQFLYRFEGGQKHDTATSAFGQVTYFSFLPPFHRRFFIDRFIDPWWVNPARAATQPVPRQLIPEILLREYPH